MLLAVTLVQVIFFTKRPSVLFAKSNSVATDDDDYEISS